MFLPYADDAPKKTFSPVTHGLIVLQAIATYLVISSPDQQALLARWAFDPRAFSPLTWLSHLFLHVGLAHFLGNALILHVVGRPLERRLGVKRFLALYFAAGAFADLVFALATPSPCVGASGAISGLLGTYVVLFPDAYVSVAYTIGPVIGLVLYRAFGGTADAGLTATVVAGAVFAGFQGWTLQRADLSWSQTFLGIIGAGRFEVAALWLVGLWALWQGFLAWLQLHLDGAGSVAYWAHLGGFAAGLAYGFAARRAPATLAPNQAPDEAAPLPTSAPVVATRSTMRLGLKRELTAVLEAGGGPSAVLLYAQAEDLGARPVLAPALQERLAHALLERDRKPLAKLALEDLVAAHGDSPEGQRAFRDLVALFRPATRRLSRKPLVESHAARW